MRLLVVLVAAALLVVGCSPGEEPVVSPSPTVEPTPTVLPTESVSVSPSPTVVSESPSAAPTEFQSYPADMPTDDPESAAIIEGWQEYQRVVAKFSADPRGYTDFSETQVVTEGEEQNAILDMLSGYRHDGVKILGHLSFSDVEVTVLSAGPDGRSGAELSYCVDRSAMVVETYDGEPWDTSGLSPRYPERATLVKGLDSIWRVAQVRNEQEQSCAGS